MNTSSNKKDKAAILKEKLVRNLEDYLNAVNLDSMEIPFKNWHDEIKNFDTDSAKKKFCP